MELQKERALRKLKSEISKDINFLINLAKQSTAMEVQSFVCLLHLIRTMKTHPEELTELNPQLIKIHCLLLQETIKYLIQICLKFGMKGYSFDRGSKTPSFNHDLVDCLVSNGKLLNAKYENLSLLSLFDIKVFGKDDRYIKIDPNSVNSNQELKTIYEYFLRIENNNLLKNLMIIQKEHFVKMFEEEYKNYDDLFAIEFNIKLDIFINFYNYLLDETRNKIEKLINKFPHLPNGNVDIRNTEFMKMYSKTCYMRMDEIIKKFSRGINPVIERLTFNPDNFDEKELRYHQIARQPIIKPLDNQSLLISPELLLDSLFINTHYSLLEASPRVGEEYKKRYSNVFLDKIIKISKKAGYEEVARNKELFEGKNSIGDLDLILKDHNNNFLIIEGKNHSLPLKIYFKDIFATKKHLDDLTNNWEHKVIRRFQHIQTKHSDYNIGSSFKYIIVSRFPEIISHYSNLLILSIDEFEHLNNG